MKNDQGFTLIEISIVLVIIGLLTGAVLKGQQMIENSKFKAWHQEIQAYRTAVHTFQDRYGYLPGDYPYATKKFGADKTWDGNGDGLINGVWTKARGEGAERWNAIQHLILAGLIAGDATESTNSRATPVGGYVLYIASGSWGNNVSGVKLVFKNIPAELAQRYDETYDDGVADTGTVTCRWDSAPCGSSWRGEGELANAWIAL